MDKKEIYRGNAIMQKSPKQTAAALLLVMLLWGAIVTLAEYLPASWFFELAAIVISAVLINKILNKGTFTKTYVLYEDRLSVITRYGLIEKESSSHPLATSVFTDRTIVTDGKTYSFYPDENLKQILKIKTTS